MTRADKTDAFDADPRDLGRYRLHGEIASGGMATVHFGRQVGSGGFSKTVAIKRLHPQFGKMPEFVSMFLAEARLAARIRHPNVVQPLDVLTVDDEIFLVMEYVEGDSLSRLMRATLARKEHVPLPIAVSILCGVLHGLHAAHEAKSDLGEPLELVHRDVSPQNVLVGIDGVPRVIDFGIAKAVDNVQFTRDGELKGKLSYMAPEQLNGHRCTRRSDIYAASVILWEVLTAQRLFDADYQSAILNNILHRPVDAPSHVVRDLPKHLDAIVLKGLARDPSDRYATARDMAIALEDSVPMATQSSVGSWVEIVAATSLAHRAARVAEIESVPSTSSARPESWPPMSGPPRSVRPPPVPSRSRPSLPSAPPPLPPSARAPAPSSSGTAPSAVLPPRPNGASISGPTTPRLPLQPALIRAAPRPPAPSQGPPPPTIHVSEARSVAPTPPTRLESAAPTKRPRAEPRHSGGSGMLFLLLFMAVAVVAFYFVAPEFVRRGYVSGAERAYGVTLTIDRVVLTFDQIRLLGVNATAREMPGVSVRSKEIDLTLRRLTPAELTAYDVVVTIDGAYPALAEAESRWSTAHVGSPDGQGQMDRLKVDSGQIVWTRPFGEQTRIDAENVTVMAERVAGRALGDDYQIAAPIFDLADASGKIGPWPVKVTTTDRVTRAVLSFDASGSSRAQATFNVGHGALTSVEVALPRTPFAQMGIQPAVVGLRSDQPFFLEGDAQLAVRSTSRVEGHVRLTATGARVNGGAAPSEVDVELHLEGDPKSPIDWGEGVIAAGAFRARPSGSVTLGDGFVRGELLWKGGVARCPGGGDVPFTSVLRFDSRNLDGSSWAVSGRCARAP